MTLLSMNELTTYRWSLGQDLDNYRDAGYGGIGVWRQKLIDENEDHAVERLSASGLSVSNVSWAGGFTGSDGRTLAESIDDAASAIRLAGLIIVGWSGVFFGGGGKHIASHPL